MKARARFINTPAGLFSAPLNPKFNEALAKVETNEELFALAGEYEPDGKNEIEARDLTNEYEEWVVKQRNQQEKR